MNQPLRVLVVGTKADESLSLHRASLPVVGEVAVAVAIDVGSGSSDPDLAWGTGSLEVRSLSAAEVRTEIPEPQPLGEDGDVWKAVVDIAHRYRVDVIVIGSREPRLLSRAVVGPAARDLLAHSDIPVLVIPEPCLDRKAAHTND